MQCKDDELTHGARAVAAAVERCRRRWRVVLGVYCKMGSPSAQQRQKKHHLHRWFCHLFFWIYLQLHLCVFLRWVAVPLTLGRIYSDGMASLQLLHTAVSQYQAAGSLMMMALASSVVISVWCISCFRSLTFWCKPSFQTNTKPISDVLSMMHVREAVKKAFFVCKNSRVHMP